MERNQKPNAFDEAGVEAMMERYRAELLRYQRATPPGRSTLAESLAEITSARTARPPCGCNQPDQTPATPSESPLPLPTPELAPESDHHQPATPGEGPLPLPTPEVTPTDWLPRRGALSFPAVMPPLPPQLPEAQDIPGFDEPAVPAMERPPAAPPTPAMEHPAPPPMTAPMPTPSAPPTPSPSASPPELMASLSSLSCNRSPARVMFAKGAGAFGIFQAYERWGRLCRASFLQRPGEPVAVFVRFSADVGRGGADSGRCQRGFSTRFFVDDGPFDLLASHLPVYPLRNPALLPELVSALGPDPATGLHDRSRIWRMACKHPQMLHALTWLYSDRGTIGSYRAMDAHCMPAVWVNIDGRRRPARCCWTAKKRLPSLSRFEAEELCGADPDAVARDLYLGLSQGERPQYELGVQLIEPEALATLDFDPFDPTMLWPTERFQVQALGLMTLERNPDHHGEQVERSGLSPANLVDGVESAPGGLFDFKGFACAEAQHRRLGGGPSMAMRPAVPLGGPYPPTDDLAVAGERLRSMTEQERRRLVDNLVDEFSLLEAETLESILLLFTRADLSFGQQLTAALGG